MNKLFKYRPLSEFLFKELFYQEIYFASYNELNDPLDLSTRIEFTTKDIDAIEYLIYFAFRTQFDLKETSNYTKLTISFNDEKTRFSLRDAIFKNLNIFLKKNNLILTNDIVEIISYSIQEIKSDINFDSKRFLLEIERLTDKFLKNSCVACFSKSNNDFLMWSHYASKHSGICLEFNINMGQFPFENYHKRNSDERKFKDRISKWDSKSTIRWSGNLNEVQYEKEQPYINFYNFAPVFENEDDCDLIGLSKSWTHEYARELVWAFSTKTKSWRYEKEYRIIKINFDKPKIPEERIRHYPIEALSSIYFGVNTPERVRTRIYRILNSKNSKIEFFESKLNGTDSLEFQKWDIEE